MSSKNKVFLNRQILFYVFNKSNLRSFTEEKDEKITNKLIGQLNDSLVNSKLDSTGEYLKYYNKYNQPIEFLEWANSKKEDLTNILKQYEASDSNRKKVYEAMITELLIFKTSSQFFKKEWYLIPEIQFSNKFYDYYYSDERELLFNHEAYDDNKNSFYYLPIFYPLANNDKLISQPHELPPEKAQYLLNILQQKSILKDNNVHEFEYSFFKQILEGVIKGSYVLVIKTE